MSWFTVGIPLIVGKIWTKKEVNKILFLTLGTNLKAKLQSLEICKFTDLKAKLKSLQICRFEGQTPKPSNKTFRWRFAKENGHNQMRCKRRKADIAAGLSRGFASLMTANVTSSSGNDTGYSTKAPVQKSTTNVVETNLIDDNGGPSIPASTQASTSKWKWICTIPSASMKITSSKEGSQPKLIASERTFSKMSTANRPPRPIATPVPSQFRPPSAVIEPTPMPTHVPQLKVNISFHISSSCLFSQLSKPGIIDFDLAHMSGSNHVKKEHVPIAQHLNLWPGLSSVHDVLTFTILSQS
ncbi:hypothetical protein BUALT_Bualt18G0054900 [Buddleja alternifolia]|uniref:Uncharacterized protein n=1 Tax=Buddleja alternifolia TaxID=168488 RepID=A0AAV6W3N5_9LAMI|nr:hypothetical protein BUALT_Bualt18G0054900 [Buddleja alternifolia]